MINCHGRKWAHFSVYSALIYYQAPAKLIFCQTWKLTCKKMTAHCEFTAAHYIAKKCKTHKCGEVWGILRGSSLVDLVIISSLSALSALTPYTELPWVQGFLSQMNFPDVTQLDIKITFFEHSHPEAIHVRHWHSFGHTIWQWYSVYSILILTCYQTFWHIYLDNTYDFLSVSILHICWHTFQHSGWHSQVRQCPLWGLRLRLPEKEEATLRKSRGPHLAGEEKNTNLDMIQLCLIVPSLFPDCSLIVPLQPIDDTYFLVTAHIFAPNPCEVRHPPMSERQSGARPAYGYHWATIGPDPAETPNIPNRLGLGPWPCLEKRYGHGWKPIIINVSGMNTHLPAILMFTRVPRFWPMAISNH